MITEKASMTMQYREIYVGRFNIEYKNFKFHKSFRKVKKMNLKKKRLGLTDRSENLM